MKGAGGGHLPTQKGRPPFQVVFGTQFGLRLKWILSWFFLSEGITRFTLGQLRSSLRLRTYHIPTIRQEVFSFSMKIKEKILLDWRKFFLIL